ncbi:hypothetical protein ABZY81_38350 [Streptomyces sp. NPDC006514]|uniref:hypothetical protein n=1 Tax=Streptomyces sp. NPDC006514 TaxID=3154308 RepID=UPI0033A40979
MPAEPRGLDRIANGQYLTNVRRPGELGKDQGRARRRAVALAAIDPDRSPRPRPLGWMVDWQRHYAYLTRLLAEGARLTAVVPGCHPARRGRTPCSSPAPTPRHLPRPARLPGATRYR